MFYLSFPLATLDLNGLSELRCVTRETTINQITTRRSIKYPNPETYIKFLTYHEREQSLEYTGTRKTIQMQHTHTVQV